jgi:hypothetical protein
VKAQGTTVVSDAMGGREVVVAAMMVRLTDLRVHQHSLKPVIPEQDGFTGTKPDVDRIQLPAHQGDLKEIGNEARQAGQQVQAALVEDHEFDQSRERKDARDRKPVEARGLQAFHHDSSGIDRRGKGHLKWILAKVFSSVSETKKVLPAIARSHVEGGVRQEHPIAIKNAIELRCF